MIIGEREIVIDIDVLSVNRGSEAVRLGFEAPEEVRIYRSELLGESRRVDQ